VIAASVTKRKLEDERGAVLVAGLLLVLALLLVIGLAVDMGRAFIERRELAAIADDAALVGSQQLDTDALRDGRVELKADTATAAASAVIDAERGVGGRARADAESVTVIVRRRVPTVLLGLADIETLTISAQATATPRAP
jgi:Flp pilus assembly protein TadG